MGQLKFHAQFTPDFWTQKFNKLGIAAKVEMAKDQSNALRYMNFQAMIISFL